MALGPRVLESKLIYWNAVVGSLQDSATSAAQRRIAIEMRTMHIMYIMIYFFKVLLWLSKYCSAINWWMLEILSIEFLIYCFN